MNTVRIEAKPLLHTGCSLGEGPRWSTHNGELAWVDIEACAFWRWAGSGAPVRLDLDGEPSCVFEDSAGSYYLAIDATVCALSDCVLPAEQRVSLLELPGIDLATARTNDGRIDAAGRIWLGTMARDLASASAHLYRADEAVLSGLTISNGIGWSPDSTVMYHVDTPTGVVSSMPFDAATGALGSRGEFARVPTPASPDGLAVDSDGGVWVALWGGGAVVRYDADGRHTHTVTVPDVPYVTAPTFGGAGRDLLFVTTATYAGRRAGDVYVADAPYPGLPENLLPTHQPAKGSTP